MEVHHHGHVHEKKKWKEYVFQFLMLFLAVFCGFLAENQLDHKIVSDRKKIYVQNLLEDLKADKAIEKMTLLPAKRLEGIAQMMRFKGRIQIVADADIPIFNPNTIIDKATFEKGLEFSAGVEYVMVNGTFVLRNGKTVTAVFPGQSMYTKFKK